MRLILFFLIGITLFFSFSPGNMTPAIIVNNDKLAHFIAFFSFTFCLNISFSNFSAIKLFTIIISFSAGIEIFQGLLTLREMSFLDFSAGVLGVATYLLIFKITTSIWNKINS